MSFADWTKKTIPQRHPIALPKEHVSQERKQYKNQLKKESYHGFIVGERVNVIRSPYQNGVVVTLTEAARQWGQSSVEQTYHSGNVWFRWGTLILYTHHTKLERVSDSS